MCLYLTHFATEVCLIIISWIYVGTRWYVGAGVPISYTEHIYFRDPLFILTHIFSGVFHLITGH